MTDYIFAFFLTIVAVGSIYMFRKYTEMRSDAMKEYIVVSKEFFDATEPLLADPETPKHMIETISILGELISEKKIAKLMLNRIKSGDSISPQVREEMKLDNEFFAVRRELEESHNKMYASWFLAVTALSPLAGHACRYELHEGVNQRRVSVQVSRARYAKRHNNDNNDNGASSNAAAVAG